MSSDIAEPRTAFSLFLYYVARESEDRMKFIDLTNEKFGKLTAISINKKENKKTYWNCVCDCGNTCIVDGRRLRDLRKTHCGKCVDKPIPPNYKDLTGKRFGMLTVVKQVPKPEHLKKDSTYWLCKCDCGKEHIVLTCNLTSGHTSNCGCVSRKNTSQRCLIDLTGHKYGRLTVLGRAENYISPNGFQNTQWDCLCECGNKIVVSQANLRNGETRSCGCLRKEVSCERSFIDLTGQRFGRLTVVNRTDNSMHPSGGYSVQWNCICDCGAKVITTSGNLKSGHTISCGCVLSKNELEIAKILRELKYKYTSQTKFNDCLDVGLLRFDFGVWKNNNLLCLIEYDGEQHYMPVRFNQISDEEAQEKFIGIQRRDKIKNDYCKTNNIPLLRIPYWENKNMKKIITDYLSKLEDVAV